MPDPVLGEIVAVGFNFPSGFDSGGWTPCNGQSLAVTQYSALYSLIGNYYGGDAHNFNLPNLNGKVAISQGQGPNLSARTLGQTVGESGVTVNTNQMPKHNHPMRLGQNGATGATPGPGAAGTTAAINPVFNGFVTSAADTAFAPTSIAVDGASLPHPNNQPTTALMYLICTSGAYPSFN
jgi:microcystin-dependent protein